jgi:uncharacterized protein (TIGR00251 family)
MDCIHYTGNEALVEIQAVTGASKSGLGEILEGRLRVKSAAPAVEGRANAEIIGLFSKTLGCPKSRIAIIRGKTSRRKTLALPEEYGRALEVVLETK